MVRHDNIKVDFNGWSNFGRLLPFFVYKASQMIQQHGIINDSSKYWCEAICTDCDKVGAVLCIVKVT